MPARLHLPLILWLNMCWPAFATEAFHEKTSKDRNGRRGDAAPLSPQLRDALRDCPPIRGSDRQKALADLEKCLVSALDDELRRRGAVGELVCIRKSAHAIDAYEKLTYADGNPRVRYPAPLFQDVPEGGTDKIILAYFGELRPALEARARANPLIELRRYPLESPEARHAALFRVQTLALDGKGRKLARYTMSPEDAFAHLESGEEIQLLRKYREAKGAPSTTTPEQGDRSRSSGAPPPAK